MEMGNVGGKLFVTRKEIKMAIKNIMMVKSSNKDGIMAELLKYEVPVYFSRSVSAGMGTRMSIHRYQLSGTVPI